VGGKYRRFPIGARAVGEVARSRRPFVTNDGLSAVGLAEPDWLSHHRVRSFAAIAIARGDTTLGVIAVFARRPIADAEVPLLEAFAAAVGASLSPAGEVPESALRPLAEIERDAIEAVLRHTSGRISGPRGAAAILAMRPTTLESRMKKLGVRRPERAGRRA
jgi:GAF domain-containing protein